jgi:hypothetical protein
MAEMSGYDRVRPAVIRRECNKFVLTTFQKQRNSLIPVATQGDR